MYAFEALSCSLEFLNYKNVGKATVLLLDIRKFKSKIAFFCLKPKFSSALISLTKSRPYLFLETPFSESEAENL